MDVQTEIRLLRLAVEEEHLRWSDIEEAMAEWLAETSHRDTRPGAWGPRIEALIGTGRLDEAVAERLAHRLEELEATRLELAPPSELDAPPIASPSDPAAGDETPASVASGISWDRETDPSERMAPRLAADGGLDFLQGWDRYQVTALLGSGGMGRVYKAFDLSLKRFTALKFLRWNDSTQVERFLREARAQARVEHPNICRVYETGQVHGRPYIAMQLIEGPTLGEVGSLLNLEQKARLVRDVARAIHEAHRTGLIHRDLKPGNIMLEERETGGWRAYVVDFGLARDQEGHALTRTGSITGTPAYLSPEQAQAQPLDRRSDVYSLGVVLYELIAGQVPLRGANLAASLVKIVREEPKPLSERAPSVPRDLETIVMKCLEKEPRRRYESARAFAEDLTRYLDGEPILARPPTLHDRVGKWVRKNRALSAVAATASVLLLILGVWALRVQLRAQSQTIAAQEFERLLGEAQTRIRFAHLQPLSDIRPHRRVLVENMEQIRVRMGGLGELGQAAGNAALGRGYFELGDLELARDHLERAWRAGFRNKAVAVDLGKVLGGLAQAAQLSVSTARASGTSRKESIQARLDAVERDYLEPARGYLAATGDDSPYVEAMIALYSRDFAGAARLARAAGEAEPLDYEPMRLEIEAYLQDADAQWSTGKTEEAERLLGRAGALLEKSLNIARSDPRLYSTDCARWVQLLWQRRDRDTLPPEELVTRALERCDQALVADPELDEAYTNKARAYRFLSYWRRARDIDPTEAVEEVERLVARAIELNPDNHYAYLTVSEAYRDLGAWIDAHGGEADPAFTRAAESLEAALEVSAGGFELHREKGQIHLLQAEHAEGSGRDPEPALMLAIESLLLANEIQPGDASTLSSLGWAYNWLGDEEQDSGGDPTDAYRESITWFESASEANPASGPIYANLGNAYVSLAKRDLLLGRDPIPASDGAIAKYEQALAIDPGNPSTLFNAGHTYRIRAEVLLERGDQARSASELALTYLDRAMELYPGDVDIIAELAWAQALRGRVAFHQGATPAAAFDQAVSILDRARAGNLESWRLDLTEAEVSQRKAEWLIATGQDPRETLDRGLTCARAAVAQSPRDAASRVALATLLLRGSQSARAPVERTRLAARAHEELDTAFALNPLLRGRYEALRGEVAESLASGGVGS